MRTVRGVKMVFLLAILCAVVFGGAAPAIAVILLPLSVDQGTKLTHNEGSEWHGVVSSDGSLDNRKGSNGKSYYQGYGFKKSDLFALDFSSHSAPSGTPVLAIADGVISLYREKFGYIEILHSSDLVTGNAFVDKHLSVEGERRWYSGYMHMSNIPDNLRINNAWVSRGTKIGEVSNKGINDIHLHFAVYDKDGYSFSPQLLGENYSEDRINYQNGENGVPFFKYVAKEDYTSDKNEPIKTKYRTNKDKWYVNYRNQPGDKAERYTLVDTWGSSGSGLGNLNYPQGLVVDAYGNLIVADCWNNRVQKFSASGEPIKMWGTLGKSEGEFTKPHGVVVDSGGNIYVTDWNSRVQKFNSEGELLFPWGGRGSKTGQLNDPEAIAINRENSLYVADTYNNRIQKFTSSGKFLLTWGSIGNGDGELNHPCGIALDPVGNVYVADTDNHRIQKFTASGKFIFAWGKKGTEEGQFNGPQGIAIDKSGNIYVADTRNSRIQKFSSEGAFLVAWSAGTKPEGIAVDSNGNVYLSDTRGNCIRKYSPTPGPTPSPTPGPTPSPTPGPTPSPTPGPTPSPTPGPTPSPTPGPTPTPDPSPLLPDPEPSPGTGGGSGGGCNAGVGGLMLALVGAFLLRRKA